MTVSGLDLRTYLATHAPDPPDWFMNSMPHPPMPMPEDALPLTGLQTEEWSAAYRDRIIESVLCETSADLAPRDREIYRAILEKWRSLRAQHNILCNNLRKVHWIRWRWYYADRMLAMKGETTDDLA